MWLSHLLRGEIHLQVQVCVKLKKFRWFLYFGTENLPRKVAEFVLSGKWEVGSGNAAYYGPIFRLSRSIKHLHISFDFYFIFTLSLFFTCCYIYALFLIVCCMCENVAWELKDCWLRFVFVDLFCYGVRNSHYIASVYRLLMLNVDVCRRSKGLKVQYWRVHGFA